MLCGTARAPGLRRGDAHRAAGMAPPAPLRLARVLGRPRAAGSRAGPLPRVPASSRERGDHDSGRLRRLPF